MSSEQQLRVELKKLLKSHLKDHPDLLSQIQGRNVFSNVLVIDLRKRHEAMKFALEHVIGVNQKKLDKGTLNELAVKDIEESNKILGDIIGCLYDTESRTSEINIQQIKDNLQEYTRILLYALPMLIADLEPSIPDIVDPQRRKNLEDKLANAKHVFEDFRILSKLEHPESRAYLRQLKEEIERELKQEET